MKKVVAAFALVFMIAEINFPVEARLNLFQKISDSIKGRKSNEDTQSIDKILNSIKGLGSNFSSSSGAQIKYVNNKFLTTTSDLTFLMAYGSFAENGEIFFSVVENLLSKMRTAYTTYLGAQSKADKTTNEQTRQKQEDKADLNSSNMQRCLELLVGNGVQALQANLQCSSLVLLRVIQESGEVSDANLQTVRKQIDALNKKCSKESITYMSQNLVNNLSSVKEASGFSEDIETRTEALIKNISLVQNVLSILHRYVNGENFSTGNKKAEIDKILKNSDYYSGSSAKTDDDEDDEDDSRPSKRSRMNDDEDDEDDSRPSKRSRMNDDDDDEEEDDDE